MTRPIIDASVALNWFLSSEHTPASLALLETEHIRAPDILTAEVRGVLRSLASTGDISTVVLSAMERRLGLLAIETLPSDPHLKEAYRLAQILSEPIYSCIYLALAMATDAPLVTSDRRFYSAVRRVGATGGQVRFVGEEV
ncbi:type II toxin-antitoxin system VapC family toxin [Alsobacter sp. KACC 23698]|uniref:Ribonuclease VapC n=1 Tax=Alsobacter sp. KACC 23698 TaxID=3149229 RepID=A0AAU7JHU5_9HYPH